MGLIYKGQHITNQRVAANNKFVVAKFMEAGWANPEAYDMYDISLIDLAQEDLPYPEPMYDDYENDDYYDWVNPATGTIVPQNAVPTALPSHGMFRPEDQEFYHNGIKYTASYFHDGCVLEVY